MKPFDPNLHKVAVIQQLTSVDGAAVLDVGCGDGAATLLLAQRAASVVGIDPDTTAIESARSAVPAEHQDSVSFQAGEVETSAFANASFDVVVFMRSL